jgi:DNA-binding response OmpR family regulator
MGNPRKAKVLLVDDSEMIRELVKETLEAHGFEVVTMDTAFGFSNALRREAPDLALVDVQMPGLSGDKLAQIAVSRGATCPVVLFSDRAEAELKRLAAAGNLSGYIRKTSDMNALVRDVERFIKTAIDGKARS